MRGEFCGQAALSLALRPTAHMHPTQSREERGRDLSIPTALEAPVKNLLHATTQSNRPTPKYLQDDVVVFSVEDALPDSLQPDGKLPLWRNREIWGRVMGTAHLTSGQYGYAVRRGDEHEPFYRIKCEKWVSVATKGLGGMCGEYSAEIASAQEVFDERFKLDKAEEGGFLPPFPTPPPPPHAPTAPTAPTTPQPT
jgi:hypothetical protein